VRPYACAYACMPARMQCALRACRCALGVRVHLRACVRAWLSACSWRLTRSCMERLHLAPSVPPSAPPRSRRVQPCTTPNLRSHAPCRRGIPCRRGHRAHARLRHATEWQRIRGILGHSKASPECAPLRPPCLPGLRPTAALRIRLGRTRVHTPWDGAVLRELGRMCDRMGSDGLEKALYTVQQRT
jgi:hypothetical protein